MKFRNPGTAEVSGEGAKARIGADLDVLLRHRPLSIPLAWSTAFLRSAVAQ
jgi:hypothetical protein